MLTHLMSLHAEAVVEKCAIMSSNASHTARKKDIMARLSFLRSIHAFREWSRLNLQAHARKNSCAVILSAQLCQQNQQPVSISARHVQD